MVPREMSTANPQPLDGWLNLLKPPGMTSHDVVAWVRRLLRGIPAVKVGHIGTLDPAAAGVLPLCLGKATRLARFAEDCDKTYLCEIVFGIETDTLDSEGRIVKETGIAPSLSEVEAVLPRFRGSIEQKPPKFSAIHIGGSRAYRLAQQGKDFDLPARQVRIHDLRLLDFNDAAPARGLVEVICSKGTYIRSLCAEIGEALGGGAHVGFLLRKGAGPFRLEDARTLEEIQDDAASALLPLDWPLLHLPEVRLSPEQARRFCQGSVVEETGVKEEEFFRVYGECLIGIGRREVSLLKPEVVLSAA